MNKPTLFLILCLVLGCITTAQASPKISLNRRELRQLVVDLIRREVSSNLPTLSTPTPVNPVSTELEQRLLGIQRDLDDNTRKTQELIQSYQDALEQTETQCSAVNQQLQTYGESRGSDGTVTLRQEVSKMSTNLENIKGTLERIQLNLDPMPTPTPTFPPPKLSPHEFQAIVKNMSSPTQGRSYNGTSATMISEEAASNGYQGCHMTVEITNAKLGGNNMTGNFYLANYLNDSIEDFELYDPNSSAFHYAPNSIPPNTKEIFTFTKPAKDAFQNVAFSYRIPNSNVRLASVFKMDISQYTEILAGFGIAFVKEDTQMRDYYNSSKRGIYGSSIRFVPQNFLGTSGFAVAYGSLQARAIFRVDTYQSGSLKIELIQVR